MSIPWAEARKAAYEAGRAAMAEPVEVPLADTDGLTLASALTTLTDLPAFPTSSVDGYAARGAGPWRVTGRVLAGSTPGALQDGDAVEIATGAMVPDGTEVIVRVEDAELGPGGVVDGKARPTPDWRDRGDEASKGEDLLPAGSPVTPAVIGLAAACGYDTLSVVPSPRAAVVIFGDELLTEGAPGAGRVRDALGPQLPGWLRRLGAQTVPGFEPRGPIADTLDAHVAAIRDAIAEADVVCTTGGTMHGPVDHLHPALEELGARYIANTVAVRPGFPMLLAAVDVPGRDRPTFIAGLPGNPQSAVVAMMTLVAPLLAGLLGRAEPHPAEVRLGAAVPGRGDFTHLALVRVDASGAARPLAHAGSAMLRGVAAADGFAVIGPGAQGDRDAAVAFLPFPLPPGGRP